MSEDSVRLDVVKANTPIRKIFGAIFKNRIEKGTCVYLGKCSYLHTIFMGYPITCIGLDKNHHVKHVLNNISPYRIIKLPIDYEYLELMVDDFNHFRIQIGTVIELTQT